MKRVCDKLENRLKVGERGLGPTVVWGQFFETDDDVILWCAGPCALWDEIDSRGLVLFVFEDAAGAFLNVDHVSGVSEGFGGGWGH